MKIKNIKDRNKYSNGRLDGLKKKIADSKIINKYKGQLCIYATGSYARKEASEFSDLDLFFIVYEGDISNLDKILIKAELITLMRNLKFPDFSGDGEFLNFHMYEKIVSELGGVSDDYNNFFTARLLLLLESYPLNGEDIYNKIIKSIIERYFKDYHDHEETFRPIFVANDIIRFWKTLCLNYEHKRHRRGETETNKNKSHLKNLKLKFSRLTTCYTFLCCLGLEKNMSHDDLVDLVKLAPLERLAYVYKKDNALKYCISELLYLYDWFLETTAKKGSEMLEWIGCKENRDMAFQKAREYHSLMYELLESTSNELLKYYTI
jgi:predicted nucleotidyltransferase